MGDSVVSDLPEFQQYQLAFTAHIRNPQLHPKPKNVPLKRMAIYRDAIFNNLLTTISACFPVCQQTIGPRTWKKLVRKFVAEHAAKTPLFKEIPFEFIQYLKTTDTLPPYFSALAHYEWVELEVTHQHSTIPPLSEHPDFLDEVPHFVAHQLLAYDYPVHQISKNNIPSTISPTYLLVYRNHGFKVKFIALNPVTYRLLTLLSQDHVTGRVALIQLATELGQQDATDLIEFGLSILLDLAKQEVFAGTFPPT
jgi:hypothetical protein